MEFDGLNEHTPTLRGQKNLRFFKNVGSQCSSKFHELFLNSRCLSRFSFILLVIYRPGNELSNSSTPQIPHTFLALLSLLQTPHNHPTSSPLRTTTHPRIPHTSKGTRSLRQPPPIRQENRSITISTPLGSKSQNQRRDLLFPSYSAHGRYGGGDRAIGEVEEFEGWGCHF